MSRVDGSRTARRTTAEEAACASAAPPAARAAIAGILALYPVWFMISTAFKDHDQYLENPYGFPWPLDFGNFSAALRGGTFFLWLKNSAILTFGSVILSTLFAALAAFAIARMRFRGRDVFLSINVALLIVPPVVMLIPLFTLFAVLARLDVLGRDHPLRGPHPPVLRLPALELLPRDPARAVRVGRDGRRHQPELLGGSCCRSRRRRS